MPLLAQGTSGAKIEERDRELLYLPLHALRTSTPYGSDLREAQKALLLGRTAVKVRKALVRMRACTRIHALRERQIRREAGAQSLRPS
jgi:hypothetical protein